MRKVFLFVLLVLAAGVVSAQSISVDDLDCVPLQPHDEDENGQENNHGLVWARVSPDQPGTEVRLFFRRLHPEVEDFYYWGVLPNPEDQETDIKTLDWWARKEASDDRNPDGDLDVDVIRERAQVGRAESRDWISTFSAGDWDAWIADQRSEPAEFFAAVYDTSGNRQAASEMKISSVREDCSATLDSKQIGEASNQTLGETAAWQHDLAPFHWQCDHVVTRIDYAGVKREDAVCRACVVAVIPFWIPATVAGAALGGIITVDPVPPPGLPPTASPSEPQ